MRKRIKILIALGILLIILIVSLTLGRYKIRAFDVLQVLISPVFPDSAKNIPEIARQLILMVRLPRVLGALFIGAGFAGTGTALQAIFQNPLVDLNILGVTSGAGFGAAISLLFMKAGWQVQITAFIFGLLAVLFAFFGSRLYKSSPTLTLTLMGILVGSVFNSLTALIKICCRSTGHPTINHLLVIGEFNRYYLEKLILTCDNHLGRLIHSPYIQMEIEPPLSG